jgi:protein-S-isoprenylcysteine O-methyltransferase
MFLLAHNIIHYCWIIFAAVWVVSAVFTKRTVFRGSRARRMRYVIPILIGSVFLFKGYRFPFPLGLRVVPEIDAILLAAVILCLCGLAFCLWARATLGRNWSGTVTLKEEHELIVRGPYNLVRHPIYTGLLTMFFGTALLFGHVAGLIGTVLVFISFLIKLGNEETVMLQQFGDQYVAYQKRVPRIIPFTF